MKRTACLLSLIAATLAPAPAALAAEIVKCIAPDGHVTLTDQPCSDGASAVSIDTDSGPDVATVDEPAAAPAVQHFAAPQALPPSGLRTRPASKHMSLAHDVATLKAARQQLLLIDEYEHPQRQSRLAIN